MQIRVVQVDAFASRLFGGNPAAVCPLDSWLPDDQLQAIAAENNLSETAYFVRNGDRYRLRWFTPKVEVDLCGHATLATAYVLFNTPGFTGDTLAFDTQSGELLVRREGDLLSLDFPARAPASCEADPKLAEALGGTPRAVLAARDYLVLYDSADEVRALRPDMKKLAGIDRFAVIVTAPGTNGIDFVSRFFAPSKGVDEDPVTGSAHCTLIPYWAGRLNKLKLHALQISERGGELWCELRGDRVRISGRAVKFMEGTIYLS